MSNVAYVTEWMK